MRHINQKGFAHLALLLLLVVVIIGLVGWYVLGKKDTSIKNNTENTKQTSKITPKEEVEWEFDGNKWKASTTPPTCPEPLRLTTPTDLSKVTGILYPGQYRGNDYKTHGGFRFDNNKNTSVTVRAPMDAVLGGASRYISSYNSEPVQYFLIFIAPCGILYRLDHITQFSDKFKAVLADLPKPKVDDSRTVSIKPPISVTAGEVIGTKVGFEGNVFFDFGVNDLRTTNKISNNKTWAEEHKNSKNYDFYGVCWFDLLSPKDSTIVKDLPAGGKEGKVSDYC